MTERQRGARFAALAVLLLATVICGAGVAQGAVGPHTSAGTACSSSDNTLRMGAPQIYAADVTGGEDWQYVAWRPIIWYWNGNDWVVAARGHWVWSWAYDNRPATWWYDFNGNYVGTTTAAQGQALRQSYPTGGTGHYYYVSDEFYWYASSAAAAGYDHLWVTGYAGDAVYSGLCFL